MLQLDVFSEFVLSGVSLVAACTLERPRCRVRRQMSLHAVLGDEFAAQLTLVALAVPPLMTHQLAGCRKLLLANTTFSSRFTLCVHSTHVLYQTLVRGITFLTHRAIEMPIKMLVPVHL